MWKVYLDMKEYAAALANCRDALQRDQVYLAQVTHVSFIDIWERLVITLLLYMHVSSNFLLGGLGVGLLRSCTTYAILFVL